jgi:rod shape-determining protein MreD
VIKDIPFLIVVFCIVLAIQIFGLSYAAVLNVTPDVTTIFLALVGVTISQRASASFGFIAGVILGIFSESSGMLIGWIMLAKTVEGFLAGYFNVPENSHATAKQKTKRIYIAIIFAGFASSAIIAAVYNPLGFPPAIGIAAFGLLKSALTLVLAFIINLLFLKKILLD